MDAVKSRGRTPRNRGCVRGDVLDPAEDKGGRESARPYLVGSCAQLPTPKPLFDGDGFGQIPRLVHVRPQEIRDVVGE
jgi:hypothetical protein